MNDIVLKLQQTYTSIRFTPGDALRWSPVNKCIYYNDTSEQVAVWGIFHELGHALLEHNTYTSDIDLIQKEVAAWEKAREIATCYTVTIEEAHIQNCLDTYRDWLYTRSTCPSCDAHGLEVHTGQYRCPNCQKRWSVSRSRFCRVYRLQKAKTH